MTIRRAVNETAQALSERVSVPADTIERILARYVSRVRIDDKHDLLQDFAVRILRYEPATPGLLDSVVKGCLLDYFKRMKYRRHASLTPPADEPSDKRPAPLEREIQGSLDVALLGDGSIDLSTSFGHDFEMRLCETIDVLDLLGKIPDPVRRITYKRIAGCKLSNGERQRLRRWRISASCDLQYSIN